MSDYFNNLLVRSFRPVSAVQPLESPLTAKMDTPGMLAPHSSGEFIDPLAEPPLTGDQLAGEAGNSRHRSDHSSHKAKQVRQPAVVGEAPPEPPPILSRKPVTSTAPSDESTAAPSKPNPATPAKELTRSGLAIEVNESGETAPTPHTASPSERPQARARKEIYPAEQVSPLPTRRASSSVQDEVAFSRPAVKRVVPHRITEPVEKERSAKGSTAALIPKVSEERTPLPTVKPRPNLAESSTPDANAAEVLPPETIINVTIGRIEVRATQAQAIRPEKQRNAPQVMSLDDYLRQRSGGRR